MYSMQVRDVQLSIIQVGSEDFVLINFLRGYTYVKKSGKIFLMLENYSNKFKKTSTNCH